MRPPRGLSSDDRSGGNGRSLVTKRDGQGRPLSGTAPFTCGETDRLATELTYDLTGSLHLARKLIRREPAGVSLDRVIRAPDGTACPFDLLQVATPDRLSQRSAIRRISLSDWAKVQWRSGGGRTARTSGCSPVTPLFARQTRLTSPPGGRQV